MPGYRAVCSVRVRVALMFEAENLEDAREEVDDLLPGELPLNLEIDDYELEELVELAGE